MSLHRYAHLVSRRKRIVNRWRSRRALGLLRDHGVAIAQMAWLADMLGRINEHKVRDLDQLLPWNWPPTSVSLAA